MSQKHMARLPFLFIFVAYSAMYKFLLYIRFNQIDYRSTKRVNMKKHILTLTLLLLAVGLYAQPGNPNNPVPLDAGLSILIAAGAAYGAKKVNDLRKKD